MKKLLSTTVFLLLVAFPAHASEEAQSCLNKLIQIELTEYQHPNAKAKLVTSIQHEGKNYHWINLSVGKAMFEHGEAFIATDTKGHCSLLAWALNSYATKEEYDAVLGKEISDKFLEASREK